MTTNYERSTNLDGFKNPPTIVETTPTSNKRMIARFAMALAGLIGVGVAVKTFVQDSVSPARYEEMLFDAYLRADKDAHRVLDDVDISGREIMQFGTLDGEHTAAGEGSEIHSPIAVETQDGRLLFVAYCEWWDYNIREDYDSWPTQKEFAPKDACWVEGSSEDFVSGENVLVTEGGVMPDMTFTGSILNTNAD